MYVYSFTLVWKSRINIAEILPLFQPDPICTQDEKPHIQLPLAMYNDNNQKTPNGKKQRWEEEQAVYKQMQIDYSSNRSIPSRPYPKSIMTARESWLVATMRL